MPSRLVNVEADLAGRPLASRLRLAACLRSCQHHSAHGGKVSDDLIIHHPW
jgi:hypothetical protein